MSRVLRWTAAWTPNGRPAQGGWEPIGQCPGEEVGLERKMAGSVPPSPFGKLLRELEAQAALSARPFYSILQFTTEVGTRQLVTFSRCQTRTEL